MGNVNSKFFGVNGVGAPCGIVKGFHPNVIVDITQGRRGKLDF